MIFAGRNIRYLIEVINMDTDTYETIRDAKWSLNKKILELTERIEVLEDKLNIEKKKIPSEVLNEKVIDLDENTKYDKVIHPVTGSNTPVETSKIATEKIIARDTKGG